MELLCRSFPTAPLKPAGKAAPLGLQELLVLQEPLVLWLLLADPLMLMVVVVMYLQEPLVLWLLLADPLMLVMLVVVMWSPPALASGQGVGGSLHSTEGVAEVEVSVLRSVLRSVLLSVLGNPGIILKCRDRRTCRFFHRH